MKHIIYLFLFVCTSGGAIAQTVNGVITYNRKTDWVSIMTKMPWMSEEQINRAKLNFSSWDKGEGTNYLLYFNTYESLFVKKEEEESDGSFAWKDSKFALQRNYKTGKVHDWIETLGKKYAKYKWKILNEIREIEGYLCMKAETTDSLKNQTIHAWYTDAIPFMGGPEGFGGLPGTILELNINEGDAIITATNVDLTVPDGKLPAPKKIKGKEIDLPEYTQLLKKYIDQSIDGKRNPYWRIRY